jgi:hypothetical protein
LNWIKTESAAEYNLSLIIGSTIKNLKTNEFGKSNQVQQQQQQSLLVPSKLG